MQIKANPLRFSFISLDLLKESSRDGFIVDLRKGQEGRFRIGQWAIATGGSLDCWRSASLACQRPKRRAVFPHSESPSGDARAKSFERTCCSTLRPPPGW